LATAGLIGYGAAMEMDQSYGQALIASRIVKDMTFTVGDGPSSAIRFPGAGPYDMRLGYTGLPDFIRRLTDRGFVIEHQARQSPMLARFMDAGGFAIYREKYVTGLEIHDRTGADLQAAKYPARTYGSFDQIPPILTDTLRFIEDRDLLDSTRPYRNPAVEWRRLALAVVGRVRSALTPGDRSGGASTLATQIEKYRHSPDGRTDTSEEKLKQMVSATARTYLGGKQTLDAQRAILLTYLNSTPLGSRAGYGEINGLGDGLAAWYGADFADANRILAARDPADGDVAARARLYKQSLSLLIAQRRPSYLLGPGRTELLRLTDSYLRALANAGVIAPSLAQAALATPLTLAPVPVVATASSFVERKAVDAVRSELMTTLGSSDLYSLDRLDLVANSSIDASVQDHVASVLEKLKDPQALKDLGLTGTDLLGDGDPSKVAWSVVLYQRGADRNRVRVHADSLNQPFDINSGAKLILGSTAKLRTLTTYLGIITSLREELLNRSPADLQKMAGATPDPLRRWAAEYLSTAAPDDRALQPMIDAALQRRYSGNPREEFFTGGGVHVFHNFERSEDFQDWTVEEAFKHSVNLSFVRLMRDIIHHYQAEIGTQQELADPDSPAREDYLHRFADEEGRTYIDHFNAGYVGLSPDEALDRLAGHVGPAPRKLAIVFRTVRPKASVDDLKRFLEHRLPQLAADDSIGELYAKYGPDKYSLDDRGYLAGVNPLELWLVGYLQTHPQAKRSEIIAASADVRQEAYGWLFKTSSLHKQDVRIQILVEQDAFDRLLEDWKRQGYPFDHLVPSLASAIGSSGDRPDALGTLMGIILNGGLRQPTVDVEHLHFAAATPYETEMDYRPAAAERVMPPEVAAAERRLLAGVVQEGTGARVRGIYRAADGDPLAIGGKTGTGDNRYEVFGAGHHMIEDRAVDRTATFVFYLGDRFYGTVTAFVAGREAANYHFTSALAVGLLKALEPELRPLVQAQTAD
jgi:membrane peptidoglycan carboxypeptidase